MFCLCSIECDEDDESLNKSVGTSGLDLSNNQGDNTGSCDDHGGNTSTVIAREQEPAQGVELVKKSKVNQLRGHCLASRQILRASQ